MRVYILKREVGGVCSCLFLGRDKNGFVNDVKNIIHKFNALK
jgi:hypothetical protein